MTLPIFFESYQSPGDIVCMTAGIRDLHLNYPGKYVTDVRTTAQALWHNNEFISSIDTTNLIRIPKTDNIINTRLEIQRIWNLNKIPLVVLQYPLIHQSDNGPYHFTEGYTQYLEDILDIRISKRLQKGHITISKQESGWVSQVYEIIGYDADFWIVVNGGKYDFTAKWWDPSRMQDVVTRMNDVLFVQVGERGHYHPGLHGDNVINLCGKTDIRQLVRLVYHSNGVICPVTFLMHLAAAVPVRPGKCYGLKNRPCIVIAGGREPSTWEAYTNHRYMHTCGLLPCCDNGGCWRSRVVKLGDGDEKDNSLCVRPVRSGNCIIPECLSMISVDDVVKSISIYRNIGKPRV